MGAAPTKTYRLLRLRSLMDSNGKGGQNSCSFERLDKDMACWGYTWRTTRLYPFDGHYEKTFTPEKKKRKRGVK